MKNPIDEAKQILSGLVAEACRSAMEAGELPEAEFDPPAAETPKDAQNGDLSSTFALGMAKALHMAPRKIADVVRARMDLNDSVFDRVWVAGAGFINVTFGPRWYGEVLSEIQRAGMTFGSVDVGQGKKIMVEFVSANPTGPMHLGNARGGVLGDTLASVYERAGYHVWREFYVNDAGNQVALFGESLYVRLQQLVLGEDVVEFPEEGYHGADIKALAAEFAGDHAKDLLSRPKDEVVKELVAFGLEKNIAKMQADLARYQVKYDMWFRESTLHDSGAVKETLDILDKAGALYEKDGATWFRATDYGCEKDEVMVKQNGFYTYYAVDIAYHRNKFITRGFDEVVDALGADHHGHMLRYRAGMSAIGVEPDRLRVMLFQLVNLMRNGEAVRMSKRTGKAITLSNLLDEISVDAARFFFNFRQPDSHLDFDLDLAVKEENDNPVFYIQYAHARICSLVRMLEKEGVSVPDASDVDPSAFSTAEEKALLHCLASFPEEIRMAARDMDPTRLARYAVSLAAAFHTFYNACRIKGEEDRVLRARLKLADCTRATIANVLGMMKITAPDHM